MIARHAAAAITEMAQGFPALAITGPRQSGKTTLAKAMFPKHSYVTLEDPDARLLATEDPRRFLSAYEGGVVLDEVQRCPDLLSYLQGVIDAGPTPGRFVLTGSQHLGVMSGITQSLAGRVGIVELLPFALDEVYTQAFPPLEVALAKGLYPPVHARAVTPARWYSAYVQTYIERDVRQLLAVRDLATFGRFLRLCAGRSGQLLNLSQLATDAGVTHNTARAWISILEASFVAFLLQPYHENFNKRLIKTPKLYFYDSGLLCWLLGVRTAEHLEIHPLRGAVFETLVVSELVKMQCNRGLGANLHFWRSRDGLEVDVVAEVGGRLVAVEIKSGSTLRGEAWQGLDAFRRLAPERVATSVLVYGGSESHVVREMRLVPWTDLGSIREAIAG